ncbi:hypothetical protein BK128_09510 [Viridibacillus sp. FSL H7-0596]|uniref:hypothetical protein n=1 Tax=Viridibacillus sp. FSL H7-0596 TaxID=1928923 RepID=UPI00096F9DFB|nr:hypothetical protein [Viridibacillus sp. FSL H7-0596]OMC86892.1 hypothetical protein BK128_09510 [Viridibacillus sp. FSL H7-0596]
MIEKSANVSKAIQDLIQNGDVTNEELAVALNMSPQMVSHLRHGRRPMQQDVARHAIQTHDDPIFKADLLYKFSGGMTPPILRGKNIERHRVSLSVNTVKEMQEAIQGLSNPILAKPPESLTDLEREIVNGIYKELDEALVVGFNSKIQMQVDYKISEKDFKKKNDPYFKAIGWLQ